MQSALIQGCKIQSNVSSIDFNSSCTHFATGGRDCTLAAIQPSRYFSSSCRTNAGSSARKPSESTKAPASPRPVSASLHGTSKATTLSPSEPPQATSWSMKPITHTRTSCRSKATTVLTSLSRQYQQHLMEHRLKSLLRLLFL